MWSMEFVTKNLLKNVAELFLPFNLSFQKTRKIKPLIFLLAVYDIESANIKI